MKKNNRGIVTVSILMFIFIINLYPAHAADPTTVIRYEDKAKILEDLGLFKGTNNGFELEREPNRV